MWGLNNDKLITHVLCFDNTVDVYEHIMINKVNYFHTYFQLEGVRFDSCLLQLEISLRNEDDVHLMSPYRFARPSSYNDVSTNMGKYRICYTVNPIICLDRANYTVRYPFPTLLAYNFKFL